MLFRSQRGLGIARHFLGLGLAAQGRQFPQITTGGKGLVAGPRQHSGQQRLIAGLGLEQASQVGQQRQAQGVVLFRTVQGRVENPVADLDQEVGRAEELRVGKGGGVGGGGQAVAV